MQYPQTFAENVADNIKEIGKNGCLAMCYIYCVGIEPNEEGFVQICSDAINAGKLDKDCFVTDASDFLHWLTGKRYDVTKKQYNNIEDIKGPSPVCYTYNGKCHWVVVENGKIVFNSLINSLCVTKGKPMENPKNPNTRIITLGR